MNNRILEDIKRYAVNRLNQEYGYCGVADGADFAMLNSGDDSEDIKIKIECAECGP